MREIWKAIAEFDGYYDVSNKGRVRSWKNTQPGRRKTPKILSTATLSSGYPKVELRFNKKTHSRRVHVLVLTAFRGPCPKGMEGCHNDGNKLNNYLYNLRWGTRVSNLKDRVEHGTVNSVLTKKDIPKIKKLYRTTNLTQGEIGKKFGVNHRTISLIILGKSWIYA